MYGVYTLIIAARTRRRDMTARLSWDDARATRKVLDSIGGGAVLERFEDGTYTYERRDSRSGFIALRPCDHVPTADEARKIVRELKAEIAAKAKRRAQAQADYDANSR
jgi:hypothetical protein